MAEGIRKARSRNPTWGPGPHGETFGYQLELEDIPVATENVFFDYDDSEPAYVRFRISNNNELLLFFPGESTCYMICETQEDPVRSTSAFKSEYNISIGFVPILGPVEHDEPLYLKEAARLALLTHTAARNFRNIWHHYPEDFEQFRSLVRSTWPGMDIEPPETDLTHEKPLLRMFCPEERIPREIFWAGFGFQVWCQMLTYIVRGKDASLFIIDEPDIYLHADLQRQLLAILKALGPDILIATHSTELITEAEPDELLVINKKFQSGKRIRNPSQLQQVFQVLGSNLNPILTQLAKTRRAVFVEGKDFQILSRFARRLDYTYVANRSDFAVIPVEGFNPTKVRDFIQGIEITLGVKILAGSIFDRDYRTPEECRKEITILSKYCAFVHIHERKELENFLLVPEPLRRAIERRMSEQAKRTGADLSLEDDVTELITHLTESMRLRIEARYLTKRRLFEKSRAKGLDDSTIDERLMSEFDEDWRNQDTRCLLIPGKEVLAELNTYIQNKYGITISPTLIISCFVKAEVPDEMVTIIKEIEEFRKKNPEQ